jgi:hypothetical protein
MRDVKHILRRLTRAPLPHWLATHTARSRTGKLRTGSPASRPPSRSRVLYVTGAITVAATVGILSGSSTALANNDPHRTYNYIPPAPLVGYCSFQVDPAFPVNKEYHTTTTLPDGSTETKTTGSLMVALTSDITGANVTLNISGPGTTIVSPDGTTANIDYLGQALLFATNLTSYGFPSNIVLTSGLAEVTIDLTNDSVISLQRAPRVDLDVCAALG